MYWPILSQKHQQATTDTCQCKQPRCRMRRRRTSRKTGKTVSDSSLCADSGYRPTIWQVFCISAHNEWCSSLRANACQTGTKSALSNAVWTAAFPVHKEHAEWSQQRVLFPGHLQVRWWWCFQVLFCQIKLSYLPTRNEEVDFYTADGGWW